MIGVDETVDALFRWRDEESREKRQWTWADHWESRRSRRTAVPSAAAGILPCMALREAMKGPRKPPNLRTGNARARCQLCKHFDGKGMCRKYRAPVRPNQLSDGFSPTKPDPNATSTQGGPPWQKAA